LYFIKNYVMKKVAILVSVVLLATACSETPKAPDALVSDKALAFAEAYLNYDYQEALRHVTPESEKWLRYAASNLTQEDIDAVNGQEEAATVEADDVTWTSDSTAVVAITASNLMVKDSIGKAAYWHEEAEYRLTVVKRDGRYYVRMACPLRSERQSRD
jgi:hypothetical protein